MALDPFVRRRWFGALVLLAALGMVLAGQTVLAGHLSPAAFFAYWLVCLVLTCLAVRVAFQDVRAVQNRSRQEHRDLLQTTLEQIAREARERPHAEPGPQGARAPESSPPPVTRKNP
jgi:hypothetical protein